MAPPKYTHSKEQSGEFLRQALPLMSKQSAALHPVSYAIWYEYVSGMNAGLSQAVDAFIAKDMTFTEEDVDALYRQHVAEVDEARVQSVTADFQSMLEKVSLSAKQTGEQANQYGSALEQWEKKLTSSDEGSPTDAGLQDILQNTSLMKESVDSLKTRLDESQSEIETLRIELLRAREEAMSDTLTGLHNRKGFERKLAEYQDWDMKLPDNLSLMMLDIDHFKRVNDTFGHLVGDKVIRAVGHLIKSNIKGQDIGVRYGGEEFLVFLPETSIDGALHLAEKLRGLVAGSRIKRLNSDETLDGITISIGVAALLSDETIEALIGRADAALYQSKTNGRNRVTAATTSA